MISGQTFFGDSKYFAAETCKTCHQQQHAEWLATWHAKMERWPSPEIIVGDFNDRVVQYKDVKVKTKDGKEETIQPSIRIHRQGGKFLFTLLDRDNPANNQTYEIAKVLGGKWNQQYEVKVGDNFIPAPIRWSVAAKDWLISSYRPYDWFEWDGTPDGRPRKVNELRLSCVAEAINRAGSTDPEAIRKALLATDLKPAQLIMPWKGVKFDPATGQNELGTPLITQWRGGALRVVWPFDLATLDVLYPLPKWSDRK